MNPHSIAAKHRDPKPELRPRGQSLRKKVQSLSPPGSPQPTPKPHADPRSPLAHPGGAVTLTKAPLVSSALNSRGEETHRPSRAAVDDHLSRPGLRPGFRMESGLLGKGGGERPSRPRGDVDPLVWRGPGLRPQGETRPPAVPRRRLGSPALDLRPWGSPARSPAAGASPSRRPRAALFCRIVLTNSGIQGPFTPLLTQTPLR